MAGFESSTAAGAGAGAVREVRLGNAGGAAVFGISRFVIRLFEIGRDARAVAAATAAEDALFRFKVDFVRRRVLPLVKGDARIVYGWTARACPGSPWIVVAHLVGEHAVWRTA